MRGNQNAWAVLSNLTLRIKVIRKMKNAWKIAMAVVLGASFVGVYADGGDSMEHSGEMMSSEMFPDVPSNHWVYEGLKNLKKHGIAVGYPDGLFRGNRTATRYEVAMMVARSWDKLKGMMDGQSAQIQALQEKLDAMGDVKADIAAIKAQLEEHKKSIDMMKPWGDTIKFLQKAVEELKADLAKLGVDVNAMKKDMAALEERVRHLENRRHTVDIYGDANIAYIGGFRGTGSCLRYCHYSRQFL